MAFVFMMKCPVCYRILHLKKTPYTHTAVIQCENITCFIGSINISLGYGRPVISLCSFFL